MAADTTNTATESARKTDPQTTAKVSATKMTFILSLFCLAILGYAAIAYVHLSFHEASAALSIPYFVVRQRTALSALAMTIAITCIIMGFATFMIGAKGEFNFKGESSWAKGALVSGVPGPFFVLCGTVITICVLYAKVKYEQEIAPAAGATPALASNSNTPPTFVARTIASSSDQRTALYTTKTAVYNDLMTLAVEDPTPDAAKYLVSNEEDISLVIVDWDAQKKRPVNFQASDIGNGNARISVSEGYLFVLDDDSADTVKALLKAANSVTANFPEADHLPIDRVTTILRAALKSRVVFTHGEPGM